MKSDHRIIAFEYRLKQKRKGNGQTIGEQFIRNRKEIPKKDNQRVLRPFGIRQRHTVQSHEEGRSQQANTGRKTGFQFPFAVKHQHVDIITILQCINKINQRRLYATVGEGFID